MPELSRLDGVMNRRRVELRLTWRQLADRAGVSYETLRAIRKGESAGGELTKANIERALLWERGSIASVEAGGEPVPVEPAKALPAEVSESGASDPARDPRVAAMLTILDELPMRLRLEVLQQLDDRIPPEARAELEADSRRRKAG